MPNITRLHSGKGADGAEIPAISWTDFDTSSAVDRDWLAAQSELDEETKSQLLIPVTVNRREILGDGEGIHWPDIDEYLSVSELLAGNHQAVYFTGDSGDMAKRKLEKQSALVNGRLTLIPGGTNLPIVLSTICCNTQHH